MTTSEQKEHLETVDQEIGIAEKTVPLTRALLWVMSAIIVTFVGILAFSFVYFHEENLDGRWHLTAESKKELASGLDTSTVSDPDATFVVKNGEAVLTLASTYNLDNLAKAQNMSKEDLVKTLKDSVAQSEGATFDEKTGKQTSQLFKGEVDARDDEIRVSSADGSTHTDIEYEYEDGVLTIELPNASLSFTRK